MPNLSGDSGNIPRQLGGVSSRTIQSASMKTAATTDHRFPDAAVGESVIGAHLWAPGPDPGALRLGSDGPSEGPLKSIGVSTAWQWCQPHVRGAAGPARLRARPPPRTAKCLRLKRTPEFAAAPGLAPHASKAAREVVVGQPAGLHEGVADGRADEAEPALLQILAHRVRLRRGSGDIAHRAPDAAQRAAADEPPDVLVE